MPELLRYQSSAGQYQNSCTQCWRRLLEFKSYWVREPAFLVTETRRQAAKGSSYPVRRLWLYVGFCDGNGSYNGDQNMARLLLTEQDDVSRVGICTIKYIKVGIPDASRCVIITVVYACLLRFKVRKRRFPYMLCSIAVLWYRVKGN